MRERMLEMKRKETDLQKSKSSTPKVMSPEPKTPKVMFPETQTKTANDQEKGALEAAINKSERKKEIIKRLELG